MRFNESTTSGLFQGAMSSDFVPGPSATTAPVLAAVPPPFSAPVPAPPAPLPSTAGDACRHVVQFFEDESFLLDSLLDFVRGGLDAAEACIVVAAPHRTEGILEGLRRDGFDIEDAIARGQLVLRDARATLTAISSEDAGVDRDKFRKTIGSLVAGAANEHLQVRVFGEMVALLWADGYPQSAVALEELWNELRSELRFTLYCAYSSAILDTPEKIGHFEEVCSRHTHVVPGESYSRLASDGERLRSVARWQHKARLLEREVAHRRDAEDALHRLRDELQEKVDDLHRLHELSRNLSGNFDIAAAMAEVLRSAMAIGDAPMGLLSLSDESAGGLALRVHHGLDAAFVREVEWLPAGGGSYGICFAERRRVIVEDTEVDPLFAAHRGAARQAGFRSSHSTPLVSRSGNVLGVLSVHFRQPRRPSPRELALMDLFSQMGADAIENAQLHQRACRELAERQLLLSREQEARAESEKASRLKDEFLATVSHELRTPLTAIIGWSHMLRDETLDAATTAQAVETIERAATSQAQLIEDILDVSRMITGKMRLSVAPVEPDTFVRAAAASMQLAASSKSIQLCVVVGPDVSASGRPVLGDASRLQQVVWNLVSNAVKFTPQGGRVEVRLDRDASDLLIQVSDTGEGIAPDFLPYLFDRFRQADGSSARRHQGLGLGLAIVRHVVELHGGTVRAESAGSGTGSTFTVRLPLALAPEKPEARRLAVVDGRAGDAAFSPSPPAHVLSGLRILVVDNDPGRLALLNAMLQEQRAIVETAGSAAGAFETLRWFEPTVIVTDLAMRGEDGFSFIRRLRMREERKGRHVPAIALTAHVRVEDRRSALAAGFNMFVPKPLEHGELIATILQLTGRSTSGNPGVRGLRSARGAGR